MDGVEEIGDARKVHAGGKTGRMHVTLEVE